MTTEDDPRTETHQGKETVPQDPGRHSGQDTGMRRGTKEDRLGNRATWAIKMSHKLWNQKALLQMTAGIYFKLCIVWKFRWPWLLNNQAEGPGSRTHLIQGTEDTVADKNSPLGVACEYRQTLDLDFYCRDHMHSTNLSHFLNPSKSEMLVSKADTSWCCQASGATISNLTVSSSAR